MVNNELTKTRFLFNEESDYSEKNTIDNEEFHSTYEETKHIYASAADLLHI